MEYEERAQGYERLGTEAESTGSGLGIPSFPPTAANIKDLGPDSDTPTRLDSEDKDNNGFHEDTGPSLSPLQVSLRRFARDRRAMVCLGIIVFMIIGSYLFPLIYVHIGQPVMGGAFANVPVPPEQYHQPNHQELIYADLAPNLATYPMGTDLLGRDIFARIMAGLNVSLEVAAAVILVDVLLGVLVGTLAGYFGGIIDTFLARTIDLVFAFPTTLFAILIAATLGVSIGDHLGPQGRLILVSLALALTAWPQMARYVRGLTLQLKEQQFVEAARTVGGSNFKIISRHILPNLFNIVLTAATLDIVGVIIAEALLSLLNLGVQPPQASLGQLIFYAANGQRFLFAPWEIFFPVGVLAILVLCFSFVGDGISTAFNPRTVD